MNKATKAIFVAGAMYAIQRWLRERVELDLEARGVHPLVATFIAGALATALWKGALDG